MAYGCSEGVAYPKFVFPEVGNYAIRSFSVL